MAINNKSKVLMVEGEKIRLQINNLLITNNLPRHKIKEAWKKINALINNEILQERETN